MFGTTTLGPHLMRDGERSARLLTSRTASNGYKPAATSGNALPHFSGVKWSQVQLLSARPEFSLVKGSFCVLSHRTPCDLCAISAPYVTGEQPERCAGHQAR